MKIHDYFHRFFLISMFCLCCFAVFIFAKRQTDPVFAQSLGGLSNLVSTAVHGVCSSINGKTIETAPQTNELCSAGSPAEFKETSIGWSWRCMDINNNSTTDVANPYCSAKRYVGSLTTQQPATINTTTSSTENQPSTQTTVQTGAQIGTQAMNATPSITTTSTNSTSPINNQSAPVLSGNESVPVATNTSNDREYKVTAILKDINNAEQNVGTNFNTQNVGNTSSQEIEERINAEKLEQIETIQRSEIISAPVVITANNLLQDKNPKISGTVSNFLKVEKIALNKKEGGKNNVQMAGKAEPNALVTIYIFSNDPVVITVKADANGNWNYELDKELADGQHEAYVAVTDNAGKIITKSEPIAFVKTAQAATIIPVSELTGNKSPIEKSSQQYILMAILIMSACLAVALVLIGFLTHKRNLDEGIN